MHGKRQAAVTVHCRDSRLQSLARKVGAVVAGKILELQLVGLPLKTLCVCRRDRRVGELAVSTPDVCQFIR